MNRQEFKDYFDGRIVLLDGATGSNLQKKGMPSGICVEQWVLDHEEVLAELQREYAEAGSNVVYASTFAANRIKFREFGLQDRVAEMNKRLVAVSRRAVGDSVLVAGDVTMTGQQLEPLGALTFDELTDAYKEQMTALCEGGVDFIGIETMMSLQETRAAVIAAKEATELPVLVTMSFGEDGRTLYGTDAGTAAVVLDGLGVDAVGVNCSAGPDKMLSVIQDMRAVTKLPIVAKPNAGLPKLGADGSTEYDMSPEEFVHHMKALAQAGATVLGGCCGTNPEYIRGLRDAVDTWQIEAVENTSDAVYITSERAAKEWNDECQTGVISSMENEELADDWKDEIYDTMYDCIDECADDEADVICICIDGTPGADAQMMQKVVMEAVSYTSVPLIFESQDPGILEAALRYYPGRTAVRTDMADREKVGALAQRYGAAVL